MKPRSVRDYWQGYGYDHLPGCPAVPRCTCGYVETMRRFFAMRLESRDDHGAAYRDVVTAPLTLTAHDEDAIHSRLGKGRG